MSHLIELLPHGSHGVFGNRIFGYWIDLLLFVVSLPERGSRTM